MRRLAIGYWLLAIGILLQSACSSLAQIRSVSVDTNGVLIAPTNFFQANAAAFDAAVGPGTVAAAGAVLFTDFSTTYFRTNGAPGSKIYPTNLVDALIAPGANIAQSKIAGLTVSLASKLDLAGGTLTGPLILNADPSVALGAATKQYVDATAAAAAGGAVTFGDFAPAYFGTNGPPGAKIYPTNLVDALIAPGANIAQSKIAGLTVSLASKLDLAGGTMTGNLEFSVSDLDPTVNVQIRGGDPSIFTLPLFVGSPSAGGHAATKTYVDAKTWDAAAITSGTISTNRLPALVKDLGALSAVTGDLFYYDGAHLIRLPIGPEGYLLVISNGLPVYSTNFSSALFTNLTVVTNNVSVLNVSQTIKVNGKAATVFSVNGTEMPIANLKDGPAITFGITGTTNATPTIKLRSYIQFVAPHNADEAGAIIYTNDNSKPYFGQAAFSGSAATNANFIEYRMAVPEDIDTAAEIKVERWKVRLGAGDTAAQAYNIGMASVADSASYDAPTIGNWIALSLAGDGSGASADVETVSNVTLTGWRSSVTPGQLWVIRVNRDGAGDASTQASYSGPLVISYGSTQ